MSVDLVPVGPQHTQRIQELASDPLIAATTTVPHPYPEDAAQKFVAHMTEQRRLEKDFVFAIEHPEHGLVGLCSLLSVDSEKTTAVVGYWVGVPHWGYGFATQGTSELLRIGFEDLGLRTISVHCLRSNASSKRVIEKLGFRETGEGPSDPRGSTVDFEMTRAEWEAHQAERSGS